MLAIKTIVHPTDFSDRSDIAFRLASSLARDCKARLIVVHVAEPPLPLYGDGLVMSAPAEPREPLQGKLHQIRPPDPEVQVEHWLEEGDAAAEILRVAREARCDLIVMGTHGRTGLGRLLMGSVAEEVVRKAPCPVLTVKTPQHQTTSRAEPVVEAGQGQTTA
jgi:nucleotide-binding universal stress UspA family protein